MSFEDKERILAVDPAAVESLFLTLTDQFGEVLPDGSNLIKTIGAFWDDNPPTRKRATDLTTCRPIYLTDGRVAFICLWQSDLANYFDANGYEGIQELTPDELLNLLPTPYL